MRTISVDLRSPTHISRKTTESNGGYLLDRFKLGAMQYFHATHATNRPIFDPLKTKNDRSEQPNTLLE
jgi:hypothetical protein